MNCKFDDLAMVVRNTTGHPCMDNFIGQPIKCNVSYVSILGPAWALPTCRPCPKCDVRLVAFLDADLQPLRPPAPSTDTTQSIDKTTGVSA